MIYPNTQPSGVVGGGGGYDNKKRLQQLLSRASSLPLFGGMGRAASVSDLPSVGAPPLSFNPFLKMLENRPGETFNNLPQGNPFDGTFPPTSNPGNAPQPGQQGGAPSASPSGGGGFGHYNEFGGAAPGGFGFTPPPPGLQAVSPGGGATALNGVNGFGGIDITNPLYHTLLQLSMYGQDR